MSLWRLFAHFHRMTPRCYGMSGGFSSPLALPQLQDARKQAARVSMVKGVGFMSKIWFGAVAALAFLSLPAMASADGKVPLPEEAHINAQLIAAAEGDMIRNNCPSIEARMLVVLDKMWALKSYAERQGYTEAEVKAFLKDKEQKARVKGAAAAYLASQGAVEGDAESYCRVGRAEIAKGSLLGSLLKE
jgi:hypothetical protein